MKIEELSHHNIAHLIRLVTELWEDCSPEEELPYYTGIMDADNEKCFLARAGDTYLAFIHVSMRSDYVEGSRELPVAYIEALYVNPAYQHRGIARLLLRTAENWAKQKGLSQLASDTGIDNAASIAFHKKTGFAEAARLVCFIKDL